MQTIVDKNTGEILYSTLVEVELLENEIAIDGLSGDFTHYDFETQQFYSL